MAVAFDAVANSGGTQTTSPVTWAHVNSAAGNAIVVGVNYPGATQASAVTYGGVALSKLGGLDAGTGGSGGFELWGLIGGLPTGSNTVSVTCTPGGNHVTGGSMSFTGAATFGSVFTAVATVTASVSVNVTGTSTGNLIAAGASNGNGSNVLAATSPGTTRWAVNGDSNTAADNSVGGTWSSPGGTQAVAFNSTVSSNDWWAEIAVEVQAPPAAGGAEQAQPGKAWLRRFHHRQQLLSPSQTTAVVLDPTPALQPTKPFRRPVWRFRRPQTLPPLPLQTVPVDNWAPQDTVSPAWHPMWNRRTRQASPPLPLVPPPVANPRPTRRPVWFRRGNRAEVVPTVAAVPTNLWNPAHKTRPAWHPVWARRGRRADAPLTTAPAPAAARPRWRPALTRRGRSSVPPLPLQTVPVDNWSPQHVSRIWDRFLVRRRGTAAQVVPTVVVVQTQQWAPQHRSQARARWSPTKRGRQAQVIPPVVAPVNNWTPAHRSAARTRWTLPRRPRTAVHVPGHPAPRPLPPQRRKGLWLPRGRRATPPLPPPPVPPQPRRRHARPSLPRRVWRRFGELVGVPPPPPANVPGRGTATDSSGGSSTTDALTGQALTSSSGGGSSSTDTTVAGSQATDQRTGSGAAS